MRFKKGILLPAACEEAHNDMGGSLCMRAETNSGVFRDIISPYSRAVANFLANPNRPTVPHCKALNGATIAAPAPAPVLAPALAPAPVQRLAPASAPALAATQAAVAPAVAADAAAGAAITANAPRPVPIAVASNITTGANAHHASCNMRMHWSGSCSAAGLIMACYLQQWARQARLRNVEAQFCGVLLRRRRRAGHAGHARRAAGGRGARAGRRERLILHLERGALHERRLAPAAAAGRPGERGRRAQGAGVHLRAAHGLLFLGEAPVYPLNMGWKIPSLEPLILLPTAHAATLCACMQRKHDMHVVRRQRKVPG